MINIRAKIEKSIRQRGLKETLRMSLYNLVYYGKKLTPASLYTAYKEREFDRKFGVDTAGMIDLSDLGDVDGIAADLGTRYEPIDPDAFRMVMDRVIRAGIDMEELTFIDYGCGKGRAVLLASHYPYRRVIGIEISKRLQQIAEANIALYPTLVSKSLSVVHGDALVWEPPPEPTLFYFYHPFEGELLAAVLEHIKRSLHRHPRKAFVVYVGGMEEVLARADFLRPISVESERHPRHGIYEARS